MQTRWWLLGTGLLFAIILVVWSINEASADPLGGVETVAIEPFEGMPEFAQEGLIGQLTTKFNDRGIRVDAANPDAVIHIDVSTFKVNESGFYLVASLKIKKRSGERRFMVFTLTIGENGINAQLRRA